MNNVRVKTQAELQSELIGDLYKLISPRHDYVFFRYEDGQVIAVLDTGKIDIHPVADLLEKVKRIEQKTAAFRELVK